MLTVTDTPHPTVRATKQFECKQHGYTSFYPALCRNEEGEIVPSVRLDADGVLKGAVAFDGWPTLAIECSVAAKLQMDRLLKQDKNGSWYVRCYAEGERYTSDTANEQGDFPVWLENVNLQVIVR